MRAGCVRLLGGDDRAVKAGVKLEDWTKPLKPNLSSLKLLWNNVLPDGRAAAKVARILQIGLRRIRTIARLSGFAANGAQILSASWGWAELAAAGGA